MTLSLTLTDKQGHFMVKYLNRNSYFTGLKRTFFYHDIDGGSNISKYCKITFFGILNYAEKWVYAFYNDLENPHIEMLEKVSELNIFM